MAALAEQDYWRAIILFGLNTATYKIALGHCLAEFAKHGKSTIGMDELARSFFELYVERLRNNKPQLATPNRLTVMERIVALYSAGRLTDEQAITRVEQEAFGDVIPRFHTVDNRPVAVSFYEHTADGIVLKDSLFAIFGAPDSSLLLQELEARWDLLEAAFQMRRDDSELVNDVRQFYLQRGYKRTDVTWTKSVLQGYQRGFCFYCGEPIAEGDYHVDHLIPRQFLHHDEIWNLVLAHSFCNEQKSDALVPDTFVRKLVERNEHLIASDHPIKNTLIRQLGHAPAQRGAHTWRVYEEARMVIRYTWEGIRGYKPGNDDFYRTFVRVLKR